MGLGQSARHDGTRDAGAGDWQSAEWTAGRGHTLPAADKQTCHGTPCERGRANESRLPPEFFVLSCSERKKTDWFFSASLRGTVSHARHEMQHRDTSDVTAQSMCGSEAQLATLRGHHLGPLWDTLLTPCPALETPSQLPVSGHCTLMTVLCAVSYWLLSHHTPEG